MLDDVADRVADVFPTAELLQAAGYHDQSASDLLAVEGPAPVGIVANNIPRFRKLQGSRTFRSWQAEADRLRAARRRRAAQRRRTGAMVGPLPVPVSGTSSR